MFTNHYSSQLNPVTNVTDIEVAEKLFAAKYITENITKTERILNSDVFDSVKEEYQELLHTMIHQYHTLSAHDFLAAHNFHVVDIEQTTIKEN